MPAIKRRFRETARGLRRDATEPERVLWRRLRDDMLGLRIRRQHPIPPYIADFACIPARLVIELDGWTHTDPGVDIARDAALHARGWRVLRFTNAEVIENPEGVVEAIRGALRDRAGRDTPPP